MLSGDVSEGIRQDNSIVSISLPETKKFEGKQYTSGQLARLQEAVKLEGKPLLVAIILSIGYGLRRSGICGLCGSDIDFNAGNMCVLYCSWEQRTDLKAGNHE